MTDDGKNCSFLMVDGYILGCFTADGIETLLHGKMIDSAQGSFIFTFGSLLWQTAMLKIYN